MTIDILEKRRLKLNKSYWAYVDGNLVTLHSKKHKAILFSSVKVKYRAMRLLKIACKMV